MTIIFEFASSTDPYQASGISRISDAYSVFNSLNRSRTDPTTATTHAAQPQLDSADFSGASSVVAAALSDSDLRTERMAALRHSIAGGTYRVPAATVADSLLKAVLADF